MAKKKEELEVVETQDKVVESKQENNNDAILAMLSKIQSELDNIKEENKSLKEENSKLRDIKVADDYDPNKLVLIRNCYDGEHITLFTKTSPLKLTKIAPTARVRLSDLEDMVRMNEGHFIKGRIAIENQNIVEEVFPQLGETYRKMVDKNTLDGIGLLQEKQIVEIFNNSNEAFKKLIIQKFVKEYIKNENIFYRDTKKIKALSDASGVDIMAMINGVEENESLETQFKA